MADHRYYINLNEDTSCQIIWEFKTIQKGIQIHNIWSLNKEISLCWSNQSNRTLNRQCLKSKILFSSTNYKDTERKGVFNSITKNITNLESKQIRDNNIGDRLEACSISEDAETHGQHGQPAWQPDAGGRHVEPRRQDRHAYTHREWCCY